MGGAAVARGLPRPRQGRRGALTGAAVVATLAAAAALSLGARHAPPPPRAYDGTLAGATLQRANCTDWHVAPAAQRGQTVRALSATIGGASSTGVIGTTLPERDVSALFDRICATPGTSSFVLYLIYAHAAAFSHQGGGPTPITAPAAQPPL
jgi:hypothetical protein